MTLLQQIKVQLLKQYCSIIMIGDESIEWVERLKYLLKSVITFAPIAWVLGVLNLWFSNNDFFFSATVLVIAINMGLGGYTHHKKKKRTFSWKILMLKTSEMVVVTFLTYITLDVVLQVAGSNQVTDGFRTALQVATLLYPASKILKNIYILTGGEHPPKWIIERLYNFQENGDLSELIGKKEEEKETKEEEI